MNSLRPLFLLFLVLCAFGTRAEAQKLVERETQLETADFADFVQFVESLQSPPSTATPPRSVDDFLLFAPSLVQSTHVDYVPKKGERWLFFPQRPRDIDSTVYWASGSSDEGFAAAWINAMSLLCRYTKSTLQQVGDNYASEAGLVKHELSVTISHFVFDNKSQLSSVWEKYDNFILSEELETTSYVSRFTETIEYLVEFSEKLSDQGGSLPVRFQSLESVEVNNKEDFLRYTLGADHPSVLAAMKSALNTEGLSCELIRCQTEGQPVVYFANVQLLADAAAEQMLRIEALKNED